MASRFSDARLRRLVTRARPLGVALTGSLGPLRPEDVERWERALGGATALDRRLRRDGRSRADLSDASPSLAPDADRPAWTDTLQTACSVRSAPLSVADRCLLTTDPPIPFAEVLLPFVRVARGRLPGQLREELSDEAHAALERDLLHTLSRFGAPLLYSEFSAFRAYEAAGSPLRASSTRLYDAFVRRWQTEAGLDLCERAPAWARGLAVRTDRWTTAMTRFLRRWVADRSALGTALLRGRDPGRIATLDPGRSDPHEGRQTVVRLSTVHGLTVAYKPRPMDAVAELERLLSGWTTEGLLPGLRVPAVLVRDGYGWMQWIERADCPTEADVHRYYRRLGALLAVLYVLGGRDVHRENVVAAGDVPVPVDLEGLFHPPLPRPAAHDPGDALTAPGGDGHVLPTVMSVGLLPAWRRITQGNRIDGGGLTGQDNALSVPRWADVNTDAMCRPTVHMTPSPADVLPRRNGRPIPALAYRREVMDGFADGYDALARHRARFAGPNGWLVRFAGCKTRVLLRHTRAYDALLRAARAPAALASGSARSVRLDALARPFVHPGAAPDPVEALWGLVAAERADLEDGDVPVFRVTAGGRALRHRGTILLPHALPTSGLHATAHRLRHLDLYDRTAQLRTVQRSLRD